MNEEMLNKLIAAKIKLDARATEEAAQEAAQKAAQMEATREEGRQTVGRWLDRANPEDIVKELYAAKRADGSQNRFMHLEGYATKFTLGAPVLDRNVFGEAVLGRLVELHAELEAKTKAT